MHKIILSIFCVCALNIAKSQNTSARSLTKIDIGFQGLGFSYEPRLSDKLTIDFAAGAGGAYAIYENDFTYFLSKAGYYISVTPKYFYNLNNRARAGKTTALNSGNYIGFRFKYAAPFTAQTDLIDPATNAVLINLHWGMQRAIRGRWLLNTHVGAGYAQNGENDALRGGTFYPSLDLKFAYILSK